MDTTLAEKTYIREKIGNYLLISHDLPLDDTALESSIRANVVADAIQKAAALHPGQPVWKAEIDKFEEAYWIEDPLGTRPATAGELDIYGHPARRVIMHQVSVYIEE